VEEVGVGGLFGFLGDAASEGGDLEVELGGVDELLGFWCREVEMVAENFA
jgi:hypothetical protein